MIKPEISQSLSYDYDDKDLTSTWYYGDYMRKVSTLLKDSENKWNLVCRITDVQNTEHVDLVRYNSALKNFEKQLTDHVGIHENPFILE